MVKIKAKAEGRKDVWIPEKESLKEFIKSKKLEQIHNFTYNNNILFGCDYSIESVLADIDRASKIGIFTDPGYNIKHSLTMIIDNKTYGYDIGEITMDDLIVEKET